MPGPGAKNFEQLFCEAFLNPGDGVLVFSPHFPTYPPNIARRDARMVVSQPSGVARFPAEPGRRPQRFWRRIRARAPSSSTARTTRPAAWRCARISKALADLVRGRDVAVFSDEPYDRMVWRGRHHSLLEFPGMMEQTVAGYTFSKSFSMSGWRLGFAVSSPAIIDVLGKLTNSALSCVPPFTQMAGVVAMRDEREYRDAKMKEFRQKVELLVAGLNKIDGVSCLMPGGTFYVFPSVAAVCNRLGITSHGLAMFLLEGADDKQGVACLGGEAFGEAGRGFLRLSCAQPDDAHRRSVRVHGRRLHPHGSRRGVFEQPPRIRPHRAGTDRGLRGPDFVASGSRIPGSRLRSSRKPGARSLRPACHYQRLTGKKPAQPPGRTTSFSNVPPGRVITTVQGPGSCVRSNTAATPSSATRR